MLFDRADENFIRFPLHNGHRCWPYYAKTLAEAAIEDLFWRRVQVSRNFAWEVVRTVWSDADCGKRDVFIRPNFYVSLMPESRGAYTFGGWCGLCYLRGDASDTKRIEQGAQWPHRGGYCLGALIAMHKGWLPQNVVPNLLQAMSQKLAVSDRFSFNLKANHRQVMVGNELTKEEIGAIVKMAYPVRYAISSWNVYWYKTESRDINFGIIYFYDSTGNVVHRLPITAWEADSTISATHVYDTLNIAPQYPLYDLDKIVRNGGARYALVCESEITVDFIGREHAWTHRCGPVTTYVSIERTDWYKLKGKIPIIFPEATENGCREAFWLGATLLKHGFKPRFLKRQRGFGPGSAGFDQDLGQLAYKDGECDFPEFAEHSQREYGVEPPDGILPKAGALSSLPEPAKAPETLMAGLLDRGELMMIYAWRGLGKSLLAMLLALCFVSGKNALNGRVCPSRKSSVLLLDGEMSPRTLKKRARSLCNGHGLPIDAMKELKIRSIVAEGKSLELETDAGFAELEPDMEAADIIIVDSVFKFFPTSMSSEYGATRKLQKFIAWARAHKKTLIVIDHEGKGGGTSYGSMGKEIALDVVIRLSKAKSGGWIQALVQKARDHAEPTEAYMEMNIEACEKGERIAIRLRDEHKAEPVRECAATALDGEAEAMESPTEPAKSLDEAIKQYVREHPNVAQGKMADALVERRYGSRATVQAHIKDLSEGGQLPDWQNRTKTHKVAEQAAPEGDEN